MKSRVSTTVAQRPRTLSSRSCCAFRIYVGAICHCFREESRYGANLLRGSEYIPGEFRVGMDLQGCQFGMKNDVRNYNWLTSATVSPICTNFSRNPMTVAKLSGDVADETHSITVPAVPIPDGVDMCKFSAML
jgi:hypothetical protein